MKTLFEDLPNDHQWYRTAKDGSLEITRAEKRRGKKVLSDDARLTITLNQVCFKRRRGRVFLLQCYPNTPLDGTRFPAYSDAYNSLKALPALAYLPLTITDAQATEWEQLTPWQQLHRSWAPHGWVHPDLAVLPFSCTLAHALASRQRLTLQGRFRSPLLVVIEKAIYIGKTADWVKELELVTHSGHEGKVWREELVADEGIKTFEHLKVNSLDDVVEFLETKYREEPDLLATYHTLRIAIETAFKKWAPFGLKENRHVPGSGRLFQA